MQKIIGLTIAALLVMGLVAGGTWAFFSDPETSTGNVLAAGTLDLQVDSENPWAGTSISVADLVPGAHSGNTTVLCQNVGTLLGDLYMKITNVIAGEGSISYSGASSEPELVAGGGSGNYTAVTNIDTLLTLNCTANSTQVSGIDGNTLSNVSSNWTLIKDNLSSSSISLLIGATLGTAADNNYQGDNVTFNIELYLAQDGQTPP